MSRGRKLRNNPVIRDCWLAVITVLIVGVVVLGTVPAVVEVAAGSDENEQLSAVELLVYVPVTIVGLEVAVREG